jgi:phospholipase/carboxylesterase
MTAPTTERRTLAGLATYVIGPASPRRTCVMLHGFGASGDDLVALADELDAPDVRFVFPAAPLALAGLYGDARAWWMIDLAALEADQRRGHVRDRSAEVPPGLVEARAVVVRLLAELAAHGDGGPLVLGGFSQGAMLALDVALDAAGRGAPPAGLALMSTTRINGAAWTPLMPKLAGTPIVLSHGRADPLLPYAVAESLRDELTAAGAKVTWVPFGGGHEIPRSVIAAVGVLVRG